MTHNEFKFKSNLVEPIYEFFLDNDIITYGSSRDHKTYFESAPFMKIIYKDLL